MTNRKGFTIFELIMSMVLVGLLVVGIMFAYLTCFRAFDSGQERITIRTKLSQAMDLMSRELYNSQSITSCSPTSLTFTANLGSGLASYTFALNGSNLVTDGQVTRATGIQTPGGSIPNIFTCTNGQVTMDMTAVQNGASVRLQNNIMPRNMPMGLVGWWQFDEATSGTCPGASIVDSSGNGNTGTCISSPTWTTGAIASDPINGAMNFNGVNTRVDTAAGALNITGSVISISAWIYPTSFGGSSKGRIVDNENSTTNGYIFDIDNANWSGSLDFGILGSTAMCGTGSGKISLNTWSHVAIVYNNGCTFYINGTVSTLAQQQTGSITSSSLALSIGGRSADNTRNFQGAIDDVRIYNRALSASEISQLYNAGIGN